jgi:hypothetical protein
VRLVEHFVKAGRVSPPPPKKYSAHEIISLEVYCLWLFSASAFRWRRIQFRGIFMELWTVRGSNPGWGEIFCTSPDRLWDPPTLLYNGYRLTFPGVKRPGRDVDYPPHVAVRLKKE